jgi:formylglycine-generating enzyme required for sulfatase activity
MFWTSKEMIGVMLLASAGMLCGAQSPPSGMARIPEGVFHPLFIAANEPKAVPVKSFCLDVLPVTNGDFLEFLRANPRWQRSQVKRIFADECYLKTWSGDLEPGTNAPFNVPVTHVSWFASKAYADWKGKRLPTVAEWEYAASAGVSCLDGEKEPAFKSQVLEWYRTPSPAQLPPAGGRPNYFGVQNLHGLVWEWTADFNTAMVTGDARSDSAVDRQLFCGGGAQGAKDVSNFPAFMRYGFRSSLKADYCVHNLGFRCAKDL